MYRRFESIKNTRRLNGYIVIYKPDHPKAMTSKNWEGYIYEHIVVAEQILGRKLTSTEVTHHEDEVSSNNSPSNLKVFRTRGDHNRYHKGFEIIRLSDSTY